MKIKKNGRAARPSLTVFAFLTLTIFASCQKSLRQPNDNNNGLAGTNTNAAVSPSLPMASAMVSTCNLRTTTEATPISDGH